LQAVYGDVGALGAEIVVLSPELPKFSADLAAQRKFTFPILDDHGLVIAKEFGLTFTLPLELKDVYLNFFKLDLEARNGDASWQLPMPARFVIDRRGIIRSAEADPDYTVRPEPEETLALLRTLV
jgi:peroxiredoxin